MAIKRQLNVLGQQRIDAPHLRMLESAVAADFDALAGEVLAGGQALIVKGFALATTGMSGQPASNLQVVVAGGVLIHPLATESGSVFTVPDSTANEQLSTSNAKVEGSFTASTTNYVGIDLRREADDTTADTVTFLDAVTWQETPRLVPLARVLNYRFIISTTDFSATPHVCPLAIVTTTATNTISTVVDARQMSYRLAAGGASVNNRNAFTWAQGRSVEAGTVDAAFIGGDRAIGSGKEWQDAVMTRLWELGGGERWFTANSDRDTKLCLGGTGLFPNGDNFRWTLGTSLIEWTSLYLVFANSTAVYNTITNGTATLADNQCLYVDVNRSTNATALTMQVGNLATLGAPTIPGSRFIIAWRRGSEVFFRDKQYEAGRTFVAAATNASLGTVQLSYAVTGTPVVAARADTTGTISNTAAASDGDGFAGTGIGTGRGVLGTGGATGTGVRGVGGATSGAGIVGIATAGNSDGVQGTGIGTGRGVFGVGGVTGIGVRGIGGATSGAGVVGIAAFGNSDGMQGTGEGSGRGVLGTGGATGTGVRGVGGATSGAGVVGVATAGNSDGVQGSGIGTGTGVLGTGGFGGGTGVVGTGGTVGDGVRGTSGTTGGHGVRGIALGTSTTGDGVLGSASTWPVSVGVRGTGGVSNVGVRGEGGSSSGAGVVGVATAGNSDGVQGSGFGTGTGVLGTGGATGTGVRGEGGSSSGAGVVGVATAGNSDGVQGSGFGTGVGVKAIGATGAAILATGGSGGGIRVEVTGTAAPSVGGSSEALQLRNTTNTNGTVVALSMIHNDAADPPDGWMIRTNRIADSDVDLRFTTLADGTLTDRMQFDASGNAFVPSLDKTMDLGDSTRAWQYVHGQFFVASPVSSTLAAGGGVFVQAGYWRISTTVGALTFTLGSGSYNGQKATIANVGANSFTIAHLGASKARLKGATSFTMAQYYTLSLIYDQTLDLWLETGRSD